MRRTGAMLALVSCAIPAGDATAQRALVPGRLPSVMDSFCLDLVIATDEDWSRRVERRVLLSGVPIDSEGPPRHVMRPAPGERASAFPRTSWSTTLAITLEWSTGVEIITVELRPDEDGLLSGSARYLTDFGLRREAPAVAKPFDCRAYGHPIRDRDLER